MDDKEKTNSCHIAELDELRKQNKQLHNFIDNSKDVLYRMSLPDGKYEFVNPASLEIFGYSPEEFYKTSLLIKKIIHPDWHDYFQKQWQMLLNGDIPLSYEYQIIHKSGEIKWVYQRNALVCDPNGKPIAIEGIVTDITERKKVEEALRVSESRLLEAQQMAHLGYWYWDVKTGNVEWSEEVYKIFHLDPSNFTPQIDSILAMSPWPEDHERDKELIQKAIDNREKGSYEQKFFFPDGNIGYYFSTFQGIYNDYGDLVAIKGTVQDITKRKRTEEAMEKRIIALTRPLDDTQTIFFEDLFNLNDIQRLQDEFSSATCVASIITHPDGTPITKPSNFCRLCIDIIRQTDKGRRNCYKSDAVLGRYNPDGPIIQHCMSGGLWDAGAAISVGGKHIANWLIGQVRNESQTEEKMRKYAREIGADEDSVIEAFREVPAMSREQFGLVAQALFTLANQLSTSAYQNVQQARFIIEHKQIVKALSESEARFRDLVEMLPEAVFETDSNLDLTFANQRAFELFGYSKEDMERGLNGLNMLVPEERGRARENMMKRFKREDSGTVEYNALKKDGTVFPILFHANIFSKGNEVLGFRGIIVDITDRKRVEKEKNRLEEQYRQVQKVESIGRLAGGVAHDLNNLLTPILGYGEMLLSDLSSDEVRKEPVEEILRAGLRAKDLVSQLLAFSRKQTLEYKTLDMNKIIKGIEKLLRRTIREDIEIAIIPAHKPQTIRADLGQIEQVIMNLAVNAQDAMPGGGKLTIETAQVKLDDNYIEDHFGTEAGDYVMLAISDTGCGMDEEIRKQIFEPFFSTKGEYGTGLGLATVYGIVKQHGGNIFVYSELDKGTTFKVYLPISEKDTPDRITRKEPAGILHGSETILLAEDNEHVRRLTGTILRRHGYTVLEAEDGAKALEILDAHSGSVNMLLTDVVMPEMNGGELYAQAVKLEPELKVLYMSGYTDNVIAHHGILDEGIQFIQKPFSIQALTAKIREVLDNK